MHEWGIKKVAAAAASCSCTGMEANSRDIFGGGKKHSHILN